MRKTFTFKLYQSRLNKHLHAQISIAAEIYNHCIALHKRYYRLYGKSLSANQLKVHLTKIKQRFPHWKKLGSQAIQDIVERIERGYQKFFRKENKRPPAFRKRSRYKSFTLKQAGWQLLGGNQIRIGNHVFKFSKSREIEGVIKTVTIKRDPLGDLYLFLSCELEEFQPAKAMTSNSAGFDFGLKTFLTPSDEKEIQSPEFFKKGLNAVRKASKNLSSKKKGSGHRQQARLNFARIHKKIANQRRDYHFKLAKELSKRYGYLFFEDLNLQGMKKLWGRKVSDLGFSDFLKILVYQCSKTGAQVHKINRFFPSSKQCHICGYINHDLSLRDRVWICKCGTVHQRDKNAAINIHSEGASSLGLGNVRLSPGKAIAA